MMDYYTVLGKAFELQDGHSVIDKDTNEWISEKIPLNNDEKLLHIGCGYGDLTLKLILKHPKNEIIGVDKSESYEEGWNGITDNLNNKNLKFFKKDILNLDENEKFNVILSKRVLHYFKNKRNLLKKLKALLKNDGHIYMFELTEKDRTVYQRLKKWISDIRPKLLSIILLGVIGYQQIQRWVPSEKELRELLNEFFEIVEFKTLTCQACKDVSDLQINRIILKAK